MIFFFLFVASFFGEYPYLGYERPAWSSSKFRYARSWSRKSTMKVCVVASKYNVDKAISGSSVLTWAGAGDEKRGRCSTG